MHGTPLLGMLWHSLYCDSAGPLTPVIAETLKASAVIRNLNIVVTPELGIFFVAKIALISDVGAFLLERSGSARHDHPRLKRDTPCLLVVVCYRV
jgi:hypothetical protein